MAPQDGPAFPGKVPFEDAVLAFIRAHRDGSRDLADCAAALGVSANAVSAAVASLERKGLVNGGKL